MGVGNILSQLTPSSIITRETIQYGAELLAVLYSQRIKEPNKKQVFISIFFGIFIKQLDNCSLEISSRPPSPSLAIDYSLLVSNYYHTTVDR